MSVKHRSFALCLILCLTSILSLPGTGAVRAQDAGAFAVADASTGFILDGSRVKRKLPIASLTKIATALVVLDWLELSKRNQTALFTVPERAVTLFQDDNPIGFQPGDQISIRDLLYAMLVQSDNISAYTLADQVGRDLLQNMPSRGGDMHPVDLFVAQMNGLARKIGMRDTRFLNPSGTDLREAPYSTATDLVLLTVHALKRPAFQFFVSQKERLINRRTAEGANASYMLATTNELLGQNGIDGVKTGKSNRAGECVILSAARAPESVQNPDGSYTITPRRLIVVVLGSTNRFGDARLLLQTGWERYDQWAARGRPLK